MYNVFVILESASSEAAQPTGEAAEATSEEGQVARSLKCDEYVNFILT